MLNKITLPQSTEIFPLDAKYQTSSLDRDSIGNLHIPLKLSIRGRGTMSKGSYICGFLSVQAGVAREIHSNFAEQR